MTRSAAQRTDAWPDPAVRAGRRGRRRRRARIAAGVVAAVGGLWLTRSLDLIDARGLVLVVGVGLTFGFVRRLVIREAAGQSGPFTNLLAVRRRSPAKDRLTTLERALDLATVSAGDAHHVLRPLVVDVAGTWLQGAHGIDLDDPRARALLPPDVWALASPASRRPDEPHAPGASLAQLDALITQLEALR